MITVLGIGTNYILSIDLSIFIKKNTVIVLQISFL